MGLFDWLGQRVSGEAMQRARVVVPDGQNLTSTKNAKVAVAEQNYVRIWLAEMFLKNDNKWFTSRFPLAYSLVGLEYAARKVELANVSGKNRFEIKQPDLGKSILRNYALTPLLPFRGGTIEIDCGLVSMRAGNVLQSFAGVVSDLAGKLNAPQVAAVVGIAESVAGGVQELLGAGEAETVLYVHDTFGAATLRDGYIFLSGKKQTEVSPQSIWITDDGARQGSGPNNLQHLDPQNYMVLRIEVATERDDWRSLSTISDPLDAAMEARFEGDENKVKLLVNQAKLAAIKSPDLTRRDMQRVISGIDKELQAPSAAAHGPQSALERAVARVSADDAASLPPLDEQRLLASL